MSATLFALFIAICLCLGVLAGRLFRRLLPENHLDAETKDAVKVAMGLIATMTALLLGLLVSSAKSTYDTVRSDVVQMSAQVTFLDRILGLYGPETESLRVGLRTVVQEIIPQMWADDGRAISTSRDGDALYVALQKLSPRDEAQRALKEEAAQQAIELGKLRTLLHTQSQHSVSRAMLVVVVVWLMVIFFSFSLFAPSNFTAITSMLVAAFSVAGALFLILEMDAPFKGVIAISSEPLATALQAQE